MLCLMLPPGVTLDEFEACVTTDEQLPTSGEKT